MYGPEESRSDVMGRLTLPRRLTLLGWLSTGAVGLAVGAMLWAMV